MIDWGCLATYAKVVPEEKDYDLLRALNKGI